MGKGRGEESAQQSAVAAEYRALRLIHSVNKVEARASDAICSQSQSEHGLVAANGGARLTERGRGLVRKAICFKRELFLLQKTPLLCFCSLLSSILIEFYCEALLTKACDRS